MGIFSKQTRGALAPVARQYPALKPYLDRYDVRSGDSLEYYQAGEEWSPNPKRPVLQLPPGARPSDVAGEIVSHDLVQDGMSALGRAYSQFQRGMTPEQEAALREQYQWAVQNAGETRPFELWRKYSGQPAFFRGNLFNQWPDELYTPQQRGLFGKLRRGLQGR